MYIINRKVFFEETITVVLYINVINLTLLLIIKIIARVCTRRQTRCFHGARPAHLANLMSTAFLVLDCLALRARVILMYE